MINLPNILSSLRILLAPVLAVIFFWDTTSAQIWTTVVFVTAALTDWLDGYLAKKWSQISPFGAFIDPVADKLIVTVSLLLIIYKTPAWYLLLPIIIIIGREIAVSALREWAAALSQRNVVNVSYIGKLKTTCQMVSIGCLIFYKPFFGLPIFEIGVVLLYAASVLTLTSMFSYLKIAWPTLSTKA